MQRRQRRELADPLDRLGVDAGRLAEEASAVDDAVADGRDLLRRRRERGEPFAAPRCIDERQLQARGTGVDDEDAGQCGQAQSRMSGRSSPCCRVQARAS